MGLFDALGIGMRGLNIAQTQIDVTGQNISNANTEGYSRKRVDLQAATINSEVYGQQGIGVEISTIARVRDEFLDRQTWEQMGEKGFTTEINSAYTRLEDILKEPTETGLAAQMNKFWASWQDLANSPANLSSREAVKSSALVLSDSMHSAFKEIEAFGLSMNSPLDQKAKTVNDLTGQIYLLNEKIIGVEASKGQVANESRDQRDLVVRKISELIDIQTIEDKNGGMTITSGGNLLVGASEVLKIGTYGVDRTLSDGTQTTELRLKFLASGKAFEPRSGSLRGIMDARSKVLNAYKEQLNKLAKALVTQVNGVHIEGYTLNKATGVYFFDPTKTTAGTMVLSDSVLADSANIAAAAGGKIIDLAALPLSVPLAASPVLDLSAISSNYQNLVQGGVKLTMTSGAANGMVLEEGAGKDYVVDYEKGTITFLNYARYAALDTVSVKFGYNTTGFSGNGNGGNAAALAKVRLAKSLNNDADGSPTQSIGDFYSAVIGRMGIEKNENKARKETREFLIAQMDSEQGSISGVSLDEEMTNMIKFENSYKASAKYIQTVSQMLEILMGIQ